MNEKKRSSYMAHLYSGHHPSSIYCRLHPSSHFEYSAKKLLRNTCRAFQNLFSTYIFIEVELQDQKTFNMSVGQLLNLTKPLYSLCDAWNYWSLTICGHTTSDLGMNPVVGDQALYAKENNGRTIEIVISHVDDLLNAWAKKLKALTE